MSLKSPTTTITSAGHPETVLPDERYHEADIAGGSSVAEHRLIEELKEYDNELESLAIQLDAAENPVVATSGPLDCCGIPFKHTGGHQQIQSVEGVKESIRLVKEQKVEAKESVEKQLYQLSPIRCLPIEVLSELFYFCLPSSTFIQPSPQHGPLLLGQICSLWRQICISSPRLWSSLCTNSPQFPPPDADMPHHSEDIARKAINRNALASLWIARSKDIPMYIRAKIQEDMFDMLLWDILQSAQNRWEKVDFDLSDADDLEPFSPGKSYPLLRSVCIRNPTLPSIPLERAMNLSNALGMAPKLHDFAWELPRFIPFQPAFLQLNWANITRLVLYHSMTAQECHNILSTATNIVSITLQQICMSAEVAFVRLTLPSLTSIGLTFDEGMTPQYLFDTLTLPALKDLLISCPEIWPKSSFMGFLNRSRCKLESLNFYYHPITENDLIEYLSVNEATLMEITIQGYHGQVTDRMLEKLTDNGTDPVWCPNLQIIAIYNALDCSAGKTAHMARSRLEPLDTTDAGSTSPRRQPLRVMEFYHSDPEVRHLEELRDSGLVLIQYDDDGKQMPFEKEDIEKLQRYKKDGLILHSYASQIGFGPTESDDFN